MKIKYILLVVNFLGSEQQGIGLAKTTLIGAGVCLIEIIILAKNADRLAEHLMHIILNITKITPN